MLEVGGFLQDGGSSTADSAVIDVLQRGQWSPGDLLSSLHHSLKAFVVHLSSAAVPHGDAAVQDALNNAAVEVA